MIVDLDDDGGWTGGDVFPPAVDQDLGEEDQLVPGR